MEAKVTTSQPIDSFGNIVIDPSLLTPEQRIENKRNASPFLGDEKIYFPIPRHDGNIVRYYEYGCIWDTALGTFEIHGDIYKKWLALGGDKFGIPTTDEKGCPDGRGRYNHFGQASIYWTQQTGAWEVHGAIRDKWASLGWEQSFVGYPISDEFTTIDFPNTHTNNFEKGYILWNNFNPPAEVYPYQRDVSTGDVNTGNVNGNATLSIRSDGSWGYNVFVHNGGALDFNFSFTIAFDISAISGLIIGHTEKGKVYGSESQVESAVDGWIPVLGSSSGSSDYNQNPTGFDPNIRQYWDELKNAPFYYSLSANASIEQILGFIIPGFGVGDKVYHELT